MLRLNTSTGQAGFWCEVTTEESCVVLDGGLDPSTERETTQKNDMTASPMSIYSANFLQCFCSHLAATCGLFVS